MVMSPLEVRACTSTISSASSGPVALSGRFRTCPCQVLTASLAAEPSAMPISRSPAGVPSTIEPWATSPRRMLPLDVFASTPEQVAGCAELAR
jgi:hypothetical protein